MATTLLTLRDDLTQLTLAPELGASLVNWSRRSDGRPLLRHSDDLALAAGNPRRLACYPLLPWSNRIGGGGFDTPAGWQALEANTGHEALPIHGSAWQQPWQVVNVTSDSARLQLHSQHPFPYHADLQVRLDAGRLQLSLQATHAGSQPTWYGLGLHPYLPRNAHTQLQVHASGVWLSDENKLSSRWIELPEVWNFDAPAAYRRKLSTMPSAGGPVMRESFNTMAATNFSAKHRARKYFYCSARRTSPSSVSSRSATRSTPTICRGVLGCTCCNPGKLAS